MGARDAGNRLALGVGLVFGVAAEVDAANVHVVCAVAGPYRRVDAAADASAVAGGCRCCCRAGGGAGTCVAAFSTGGSGIVFGIIVRGCGGVLLSDGLARKWLVVIGEGSARERDRARTSAGAYPTEQAPSLWWFVLWARECDNRRPFPWRDQRRWDCVWDCGDYWL